MAFANDINYAQIFQTLLDEQMVQEARTGWMVDNAGLVQYDGGKQVKIPKLTMTGLGNYSRANGYPEGSVTLEYETRDMTMDRAAQFLLDQMDVNETNFVANATTIMSEFQRTQVIPEVDAYRISKLATYAIANTATEATNVEYGYTPAPETIIAKLAAACEIAGDDAYIMATPATCVALESKIGTNNIESVDFTQAGFDQRVPAFNGRPIIKVDPARMVTAITVADLANGAGGGWSKGATAKDINFIVCPRIAPIGIDKLDEPKIFDPSVVQEYSGWLIDYRRYFDMWVMDNKIGSIAVNIKQAKSS